MLDSGVKPIFQYATTTHGFCPTVQKIVFERLEDPESPHGNYNILEVGLDGTQETRLTNTNCSQGLASWSHSAEKTVYIVAPTSNKRKYNLYLMKSDGSANHSTTPE